MAKPQIKKSLEQFNQELAGLHMSGQWIYEDLLNRAINGPRPKGDPYLWPWKLVCTWLLIVVLVLGLVSLDWCPGRFVSEEEARSSPRHQGWQIFWALDRTLSESKGSARSLARIRQRACLAVSLSLHWASSFSRSWATTRPTILTKNKVIDQTGGQG